MKCPRKPNSKERSVPKKTGRNSRNRNQDQITEMLKLCLEKVVELQAELEEENQVREDPQSAGYVACALETLTFLERQGLSEDHPMVKALREKLLPDSI